jgi:hypothetical protein
MDGPTTVVERMEKPLISDLIMKNKGRRPRVVKIEDTYYVTYTAYDASMLWEH